jgi:hypothetical protein
MDLQDFCQKNLFDATQDLFEMLGIKLNSNTKQALSIRDVLKTHYKESPIFHAAEETYLLITFCLKTQQIPNTHRNCRTRARL